jgi:hypothetical protein
MQVNQHVPDVAITLQLYVVQREKEVEQILLGLILDELPTADSKIKHILTSKNKRLISLFA